VKLAPGGIRDVEFLVQCLQRLHGGRVPWLRHGGTMLALSRLSDKDLLSAAEFGRLISAYRFCAIWNTGCNSPRTVRRIRCRTRRASWICWRERCRGAARQRAFGRKLLQELNAHLEAVQEIYERVIHAQRPDLLQPAAGVTPSNRSAGSCGADLQQSDPVSG
jgi:glutamate-ammonia-ligase adenylyltransferase